MRTESDEEFRDKNINERGFRTPTKEFRKK